MRTHEILSLVEQTVHELARTVLQSEPRVTVFLFGSRATGKVGIHSDVDVAFDLGHAIAPEILTQLRDAFDALPMLQKVDVVDCATIDERFKAVAFQRTRNLYERQAA